MKMKKVNKKILKVVERVVRHEVEQKRKTWPPFCTGIFHQPKRPVSQKGK